MSSSVARCLLIAVLLIPTPAGPTRADQSFRPLNQALSDDVVIPAYRQLESTARKQAELFREACEVSGERRLERAREAFSTTLSAWQRVQPLAYGPVTWMDRGQRIQLWPDRRNAVPQAVSRALDQLSSAVGEPPKAQSLADELPGLSALEILLFGAEEEPVPEALDEAACDLASALADSLATTAGEILADWTKPGGFREAVASAAGGNDSYFDEREAASDLLRGIAGTLDVIIARKLEPVLGRKLRSARPQAAESWRSERSFANIRDNLTTAFALFAHPEGFAARLETAGAGALAEGMTRSFEGILADLEAPPAALLQAVSDPAHRSFVEDLLERLRGLRVLVKGQLARELDLILGFNELDGD